MYDSLFGEYMALISHKREREQVYRFCEFMALLCEYVALLC